MTVDTDTMPKNAGRSPNLKGGSRKGVPNKVTKALKAMILGALDDAGGQKWLLEQAGENPVAFMSLIGKVLPTTLANDADNPLTTMTVEQIDAKLAALLANRES